VGPLVFAATYVLEAIWRADCRSANSINLFSTVFL
jgi:hypothetical protein